MKLFVGILLDCIMILDSFVIHVLASSILVWPFFGQFHTFFSILLSFWQNSRRSTHAAPQARSCSSSLFLTSCLPVVLLPLWHVLTTDVAYTVEIWSEWWWSTFRGAFGAPVDSGWTAHIGVSGDGLRFGDGRGSPKMIGNRVLQAVPELCPASQLLDSVHALTPSGIDSKCVPTDSSPLCWGMRATTVHRLLRWRHTSKTGDEVLELSLFFSVIQSIKTLFWIFIHVVFYNAIYLMLFF